MIGAPQNRIDGPLKVGGRAPYAADYAAKDLLYGVVVASPIANGRIRHIETSTALAFPRVVDVFTHENRPSAATRPVRYKDMSAPSGTPFRPLLDGRILFAGQPVALVVAETYEAARDAADLVRVSYDEAAFVTALARAMDDDPQEYEDAYEPRGDSEAALAAAQVKIDVEYRTMPLYHNAIELFASTAVWDDGRLTVYDKTQGPQNVHLYLRLSLGLRVKAIRVVNAYVGGAFGSGLRPSHTTFLAALAAKHLRRSVRVVLTRAQMYGVSYRPDAIQHVKLGCDREGRLVAVEHRSVAATSTYEDHDENIVGWSGLAYACPNATLKSRRAQVSRPTPADMRAPGAATGEFALECAMDELAVAAQMDPVAIRLANWTDRDQNEDRGITSKAQRECYAVAAARFGWSRRNAKARSTREGRELVGWGMAGGVWDALVAPTPTRARVTWGTDGILEVAAAASDIGTGTYTILAQIAADAFDIDAQDVRVRLGDSTLPVNPVEGGSWMAASTGAAVAKACDKLKRMLVAQARARHGLARGTTAFNRGRIAGIAIGDIVASGGKELSALATNLPDVVGGRKYVGYSHSAVFAEVRVDEELGIIRVTRVVTAIAAGRIINPKTARSQIVGGVVMGIGYALHEEGLIDHRFGKVMNANLADYHVPAHADIYDIDVVFVDEQDDKVSPLGVKGVGEIGVVAVAPAIANAIFHATGRRVRDLPITLDKLL